MVADGPILGRLPRAVAIFSA